MSRKFQQNRQKGKSHQFTIELVIPHGHRSGMCKTDYAVFDVIQRMKRSVERYMLIVNGEARFYSGDVML